MRAFCAIYSQGCGCFVRFAPPFAFWIPLGPSFCSLCPLWLPLYLASPALARLQQSPSKSSSTIMNDPGITLNIPLDIQDGSHASLPLTSSLSTSANAAATTPKRYRSTPAKTFQCTGFGDCRMVFSRSEHLARHIRSAIFPLSFFRARFRCSPPSECVYALLSPHHSPPPNHLGGNSHPNT
jgi:hypothetical protein